MILLALQLGSLLAACGDDATAPGEEAPIVDAGAVDSAVGGTDASTGMLPMLSACERACDRVVDCAVNACQGADWRTAGEVNGACSDACDEQLAEAVLGESDCDGVFEMAVAAAPKIQQICDSDICETACDHFADCVIQECEAVVPANRGAYADSCIMWCDDENAGQLLGADCVPLVESLQDEPAFAASCSEGDVCAQPDDCAAYAKKVSGCLVDNCGVESEPFGPGLEQAFAANCDDPMECPSAGEAAYVNAETTTCDSDGLVDLPELPVFDGLCNPPPGATGPEVRAACEAIETCPFFVSLASVDLCMVSLAFDPDTPAFVTCLLAGADCTEQEACF